MCGTILLKYFTYPCFNIFLLCLFQGFLKGLYCSFSLTVRHRVVWGWGYVFFKIWTGAVGSIVRQTLVRQIMFRKGAIQLSSCNAWSRYIHRMYIQLFGIYVYNDQEHFSFTGFRIFQINMRPWFLWKFPGMQWGYFRYFAVQLTFRTALNTDSMSLSIPGHHPKLWAITFILHTPGCM